MARLEAEGAAAPAPAERLRPDRPAPGGAIADGARGDAAERGVGAMLPFALAVTSGAARRAVGPVAEADDVADHRGRSSSRPIRRGRRHSDRCLRGAEVCANTNAESDDDADDETH